MNVGSSRARAIAKANKGIEASFGKYTSVELDGPQDNIKIFVVVGPGGRIVHKNVRHVDE